MGTAHYMPPEQARGQKVDHRADVYGLGTILYTNADRRPPYEEETPQANHLGILNSEPPRPRSLVPDDSARTSSSSSSERSRKSE